MMKFLYSVLFVYVYAAIAFGATNLLVKRDQENVAHELYIERNSLYSYPFHSVTLNDINLQVDVTVIGRLNTYTEQRMQNLVNEHVRTVDYTPGVITEMMSQIYIILAKKDYEVTNIRLKIN